MKFDIDDYKRRTGRLDLDGIDLEVFAVEPLQPDALRCLRYMHDVEYHTVCYLRGLLLTSALAGADYTAVHASGVRSLDQPGRSSRLARAVDQDHAPGASNGYRALAGLTIVEDAATATEVAATMVPAGAAR